MSTMINMSGITPPASGTTPLVSAPAQANGAESTNLADIFSLLFRQVSATQTAATTGSDGIKSTDPSAKIADMLSISGPTSKKEDILNDLLKKLGFTQQEIAAFKKNGVNTDDVLKKTLQGLLASTSVTPGSNDIKPALLRDLTTEYTTEIQSAALTVPAAGPSDDNQVTTSIEDILAIANDAGAAPTDDLASLLNNLEPGSNDASGNAPNENILSSLKEKLANFINDQTPATDEKIKTFKEGVVQFLNDNGIDGSQINKYLGLLTSFVAQTKSPEPNAAAPSMPAQQIDTSIFARTKIPDTQEKPAHVNALYMLQEDSAASLEKTLPSVTPSAKEQPLTDDAGMFQKAAKPDVEASIEKPQKSSVARPLTTEFISQLMADGNDNFSSDDWQFQPDDNATFSKDSIGHLKGSHESTSAGFSSYLAAAKNAAAPNMQTIVMQIQKNAAAKTERMTIQLSPAELGNLEIRMKFEKDGNVKTHLIADKAETFNLLQKDAQQLQRTLQQAGIDVDENSLSFDLRQDSQQQHLDDARDHSHSKNFGKNFKTETADNLTTANIAANAYGYITRSGVNIMV